jgi:xanthine dehydrogenase small subunit
MGGTIRFLFNGAPVAVDGVDPSTTVLTWLRTAQRCTGTKEGCAEGDCGACTVVVGSLAAQDAGDDVALRAVNACIRLLPTLDGKALYTVEYLRRSRGGALHPVQQAMVDCHGSQCGFCTPGFVMSLWALYLRHAESGTRPDERETRTALAGNLCRCTGYRPILDAASRMFDAPLATLDRAALAGELRACARNEPLVVEAAGHRCFAPRSLTELVAMRAAHPDAVLLAGGTDVGLWLTKQLRDIGTFIHVGEVAELLRIEDRDGFVRIGAAVPLEDAYAALFVHYPQVRQMWERFASVPIRNAGTLGGNVANGSPIGDSMPWLIAVGARVILRNTQGARRVPLEDLYVSYGRKAMAGDEIVEAIEVPYPAVGQHFRTYKVAKRYDSDISAVCAAFAIVMDGDRIEQARVAFGGMAATPRRAASAEAALAGQAWSESTARAAMDALARDYTPLTDLRATASYRIATAQNLLYRFFLETRPDDPLPPSAVQVFAAA